MTIGTVLVVAYGLGAIPFALLVARRVAGTDVRQVGSGNLGAANVLRTTRPAVGFVVLGLDVAKGAAAVWLAGRVHGSDAVAATAAVSTVIGHLYPVWLGFQGGKGVATAGGAFAALSPLPTTIAVGAFAAVVAVTRYVSLGSVVAAMLLPASIFVVSGPGAMGNAAVVVAALIVFRHRSNVARLVSGTERRLEFRRAAGRREAV